MHTAIRLSCVIIDLEDVAEFLEHDDTVEVVFYVGFNPPSLVLSGDDAAALKAWLARDRESSSQYMDAQGITSKARLNPEAQSTPF